MYEKKCYKNPFIKEAIMRFDFPSPISEIEKSLPAKISKAALKYFPIFEPQKMQTHEVQFDLVEQDTKSKVTEITNQIFHGLEKEKTLTIAPNVLSVQVRLYKTFELFLEETLLPLRALCEAFPEIRASRVGLRYVNILTIGGNTEPLDWKEYINPQLLAINNFGSS